MKLFDRILAARGLDNATKRQTFLSPDYGNRHDPFLLPDMKQAVDRLVQAHKEDEVITIYGDYDIDGLTATTLLMDAFEKFGFKSVDAFIPNRFVEGYGMTVDAVEKIAETGASLILTVDCGSLSHEPIERAKELGVDVIVTDHHNVAKEQPPAVAVINPKRLLDEFPDEYENFVLKPESKRWGELYPFLDLPGVGVAFKLVQALQSELTGLGAGQEKWLLDLVALGTVCDVVTLQDENRMHVYWGLKVMKKLRRQGLKALMAVANVEPEKLNARSLGFALGPRMNAAGRLETAQIALDMLRAQDGQAALEKAQQLDEMNMKRRAMQDKILKQALIQAEKYENDSVLVVSNTDWSHGIIGIVAARLLETFSKPTFVIEELGEEAKGSARSYGDFSAADAIRAADDIITKGGGHKLAAGVTLPTANIEAFRERVNQFYVRQKLVLAEQQAKLLPLAETVAALDEITDELVDEISRLEPFGSGNKQPVIQSKKLKVHGLRRMGSEGQHIKLMLGDDAVKMEFLAFSAPEHFFVEVGQQIDVWYHPDINEWRGRRNVEARLLHLQLSDEIS